MNVVCAAASGLAALVALGGCAGSPGNDAVDRCRGERATVVGSAHDDRLRGTSGDDVIVAGEGDDRVVGLGGDDLVCGGGGADVLVGGDGDDVLYGEGDSRVTEDENYHVWYGDTLAGGPGDDVLDGGADPRHQADEGRTTLRFGSAAAGVVVDLGAGTAAGEGHDTLVGHVGTVTGSAHSDHLRGTSAGEVLEGGGGDDVLAGRGGPDVLLGDADHDRLTGGAGRDELQGDRGADRLYGGPGDDNLVDVLEPTEGQVLDGGAGDRDSAYDLFVAAGSRIVVTTGTLDLARGLLRASYSGTSFEARTPGLEDAIPPDGDWTVLGGPPPGQAFAG